MIIHETLGQLGITDRQTDIYLALLKLGPSSIRDIAAASGVNRGTTYDELKQLRELRLVTYSPQGKRRFFCAEPPEVLRRLAEARRDTFMQALDTLETDVLPDLSSLVPESTSHNVFHYEGDEGIEYVLRDILATVDGMQPPLYRVYSSRHIRKYLYRPFPGFTRARVAKGIEVNVIAIGEGGEDAPLARRKWIEGTSTKKTTTKKTTTKKTTAHTITRHEESKRNSQASYVAIYGSKCAMISLVRGDYPIAVILDSDAVATAMTISFDTLWNLL